MRGHSISQASLSLAGSPLLDKEIASRRAKPSTKEPTRHQGCVQPTLAKVSSLRDTPSRILVSLGNNMGQWQGQTPTHSSSDCLLRHSAHTHNVSATKNIDRVDLVGLGYQQDKQALGEMEKCEESLCSEARDREVVGGNQKCICHAHSSN